MKLPVLKAFAATLAYAGSNAAHLLKALWLPVLGLVAAQLYVMPKLFTQMGALLELGHGARPEEVFAAMGPVFGAIALMFLASAIFQPMIVVAALRKLIRGDDLRLPFYFNYSGAELRVLGAYILKSLMILLISIVGQIAFAVIGALFRVLVPKAALLVPAFGRAVVNVVIIWFQLRLCVLYPAAVGSETLGFGQAWGATKGNVWRLLFYWVLIGVALFFFLLIASIPGWAGFAPVISAIAHGAAAAHNPAAELEAAKTLMAAFAKVLDPSGPHFIGVAVALYLMTLTSAAFNYVSSGVAYRFIAEGE
ncbi:MAG: hypothetical protein GC153_06785 [Alphaproteobacteria bacterium]|nr:hypothetical protein [Alphaproteobacteria bacterium]